MPSKKVQCQYCNKEYSSRGIKTHLKHCDEKPVIQEKTKTEKDTTMIKNYAKNLFDQFKDNSPLFQKLDNCFQCPKNNVKCIVTVMKMNSELLVDHMNNRCIHPELSKIRVKEFKQKLNQCLNSCSFNRICLSQFTGRISESTVNAQLKQICKVDTHGL